MPAYVIVDVKITDQKEYEEYKKLTPSSIAAFDGRFIVRGGKTENLEGNWQPERIVILEFPTVDRASNGGTLQNTLRQKVSGKNRR